MTEPTLTAPSPAPPQAGEQRVAVLSGDRLCASCCFNLAGQTVVRETHYGLLIVRCPECGTPAALQEYPALGRWAGRLGMLAAGLWILGLIALSGLTALAIYLLSSATTSILVRSYAEHLSGVWSQYQATLAAQGPQMPARYYGFDTQWWAIQDRDALFAAAGGWTSGIDWRGLWIWAFGLISLIPLGAVWAAVAPHARIGRMAVITLFCGGIGAAFLAVDYFGNSASFGWYSTQSAAYSQLGLPLHALSLGFCMLSLFVGMRIGRPLARGLTLLLLPPRLRAPLAFLWIADNRPLPRRG